MTLNPLNHVHWFLTIVLPIVTYLLIQFPFGGARPVMVDAGKIGPRRMALVAMAGPLGNAIFAVICAIVTAALMAFGVINEVERDRLAALQGPDPLDLVLGHARRAEPHPASAGRRQPRPRDVHARAGPRDLLCDRAGDRGVPRSWA